jgi:hypothetical protein
MYGSRVEELVVLAAVALFITNLAPKGMVTLAPVVAFLVPVTISLVLAGSLTKDGSHTGEASALTSTLALVSDDTPEISLCMSFICSSISFNLESIFDTSCSPLEVLAVSAALASGLASSFLALGYASGALASGLASGFLASLPITLSSTPSTFYTV